MLLKRLIPLLVIMLTLAGCFRQANETFEGVDSQSAQTIPTDDQPVTIIDPNATNVPEASADSQSVASVPTNTVAVIVEPTATNEPIILPATSTPLTVPTATEATFETPEALVEVVIPTATEVQALAEETLEPTPTTEDNAENIVNSDSECEYVVQSGDNLFRISLDYGVSLRALLEENGLSEASIIQPDQVLTIPNCDEDGTSVVEEAPTEETATEEPMTECQYLIVTGDTLYDIAIELDVSLDDLREANDLTDSDFILPGEYLDIPDCDDGGASDAGDSMDSGDAGAEVTEAVSNVTIHTVTGDDTLLSIAQLYGVTVNDIIQNNSIPDPNKLSIGQQLLIPEVGN